MLIAAVSLTGGILAQRKANIPEIEIIDVTDKTETTVTSDESVSAEASAYFTETVTYSAASTTSDEDYVININTASAEELMSLKGVGEKTAAAIIEYRENTPFEKPEDIMNVKGIGEKKFENIKEHICV